ncbi:class II aldolase/adducin family protein [Frankia sp. CiP1_Cm_nod2]|uniref:class II aldolase/adducin family protein n=1 Tax=Frankia sp. CiP1_Cm_nod2 TaxID=2897161 RepID=UPI002024702F
MSTSTSLAPSIREQFRRTPLRVADQKNVPKHPEPEGSVEEIRLHRKQRLAAAFRLFAKFGYDHGIAGHITARDPELPDHFWVNPLAVPFAQIKVSDLLLVSHDGDIVIGDRPVNTAAFAIHSQVHTARPDVVAAAHAHALAGKAWSSLGRLLDPITQDALTFYGSHSLYADFNGVVLDKAEGRNIAEALGPNKLVILQNHGFLTVGRSVEEAAWLFVTADQSAHAQLLAEAAGRPKLVRHEVAEPLGRSRSFGGFSFAPYWDVITAEQPDLFD